MLDTSIPWYEVAASHYLVATLIGVAVGFVFRALFDAILIHRAERRSAEIEIALERLPQILAAYSDLNRNINNGIK